MMEMENIDKMRIMLNNRMYCDYFKLYGLISHYIKENVKDLEINDDEIKTFPPYKDLEPLLEYKMENLKDLHENTLFLINKLHDKVVARNDDIDDYNVNHKIGFTISNFLNTLEYENTILKEQISLYINYTAFFQISQKKQLSRLLSKFDEFHKEIQTCLSNNTMYSVDDIEDESNDTFYVEDLMNSSESELETENTNVEDADQKKDVETNKDPDTISEQNTISEKNVVVNDVIPLNETENV
jgi:virulence-associated protein VapD